MFKKIVFISFLALLFSNCTIQKRTHQKGYFVQWNHKNKMTSRSVEKDIRIENSSSQLENDLTDSLNIYKSNFKNEISRKTEDKIIKNEDEISNEKPNEALISNNESMNKVNYKEGFLKKKKDKLEKEKSDFPLLFVIGFLSIIFGLVLIMCAFSTKYLNNSIYPGLGLTVVGFFLLFIAMVQSITKSRRLKYPKPEKPINEKLSKVKSKRMKVFFLVLLLSMISIGLLFSKS